MKQKYFFPSIIISILAISFFLRAYKLESYPLSVNQDELSNIYDGYSIAETGADRWGIEHPMILRAFGDYRPPVYSWISALSVKLFGYSIFAGRFPSAVIGLLSLVFLFLVSKKIAGKLFSFFVLLLAAFSPWHLLFSRMALEAATLPSLFMILTLYLWIIVKERKYNTLYVILLGLTVGFGSNTYQSSKLIFPLLAIILFIDLLKHSDQRIKKAGLFTLFFFIGISPQLIMAFSLPEHYFLRANNTMMPFSFSFDYLSSFLRNYFSNLGPDYLFFSFGEYNNLSLGRLLVVEFPFFYLGLLFFGKVIKKTKAFHPTHLYLLLAISIFPSALTGDNPHALRASCLMILFPLVTASGILFILNKIKDELVRNIFFGIMTMLILVNAVLFIVKYVNSYDLRAAGQQNFLVLLSERLNSYKDQYSRIYMEDIGNQPGIYVAGYCNMTPLEFQKTEKEFNPPGEIHLVRLGKYFFLDRDNIEREVKNLSETCLFLLQAKEVNYHLIDSVDNGFQKIYFYDNQRQPFLK